MTEETKPTKRTRKSKTPEQSQVELPPTQEERSLGNAGNPNKYAPKPKIGNPTLGRSTNYVDSVGLGNLKVRSANGYTDV